MHFAWIRAEQRDPAPVPIILSHGWPYTFAEMLPIAAYLVDPARHGGRPGDTFDVVIPSLPGFGFSDAPGEAHFVANEIAERWHALIHDVLGYERYATYGEDVGTWISDWTAALHPDSVLGLFATHAAFPSADRRDDLTEEEIGFRAALDAKWLGESAYSDLQSTKPDTLAAALNDSPAGLAAWLVEKFRTWSGGDDAYRAAWSDDDVLTTATLYWATQSIGTSFRAYFDDRFDTAPMPLVEVPVGVAVQYREQGFPQSYAARTYRDIRDWQQLPSGGHFTVKQSPELVASAMREFFRPLRESAVGRRVSPSSAARSAAAGTSARPACPTRSGRRTPRRAREAEEDRRRRRCRARGASTGRRAGRARARSRRRARAPCTARTRSSRTGRPCGSGSRATAGSRRRAPRG